MVDREKVVDFDWAFGLNRFSMQVMGIWPKDNESAFYRLRITVMILILVIFNILPQMYALEMVIHELPYVVDNLLTSSSSVSSLLRLIILSQEKKEIKPIIESTMQDWRRPRPKWAYEIMQKQAKKGRIFTLLGYVFLGGCYSGFLIGTLFNLNVRIINNITDYGDNRYLFIQSYYPYDYSPSPIFELTNFTQVISGFVIGMAIAVPENYFGALVYHISGQFQILGENLKKYNFKDERSSREGVGEYERLKHLIRRHAELSKLVVKLDDTFSFVIMAQLLCLYTTTTGCGFSLLFKVNNSQKIEFLQGLTLFGTFTCLITFAFCDCYASENLYANSSGIFTKIYGNSWYDAPKRNRMSIMLIMMYAQKPKRLTAGKLFPISLKFFCNILNTIGSYITLLFTVSKK